MTAELVVLALAVIAAVWATYSAAEARRDRQEIRRQLAGIRAVVDHQLTQDVAIREVRFWLNPHSARARAPLPAHLLEAADRLDAAA